MKKNIRNYIITGILICTALIFICYPFMCTELHIKLYFEKDSAFTDCKLYYSATDSPDFNDNQVISAALSDYEADFTIPRNLCGLLKDLRLDLSHTDTFIAINRVELCSGGFIRKSFQATDFFREENVILTNDIDVIQNNLYATYITTSGEDPYIILHPNITAACNDAFSHYTITKAVICGLIAVTFVLARRKFFSAD